MPPLRRIIPFPINRALRCGTAIVLLAPQVFAQSPAEAPVPAPAADAKPAAPVVVAPPAPARPFPAKPPRDAQVEIESRFFEVPEAIADSLGLLSTPEASRPKTDAGKPKAPAAPAAPPAEPGLNAIMSPAEKTQLLQKLKQAKGVDLLSAPRVTTRSGQRAVIEIIREFRYPTEFQFEKERGIQLPTAFETRNLGVTLEIDPIVSGEVIDLQLVPQVVELEGYMRAGDGQPVPLLNGRSVGANMTLKDLAVGNWPKDTVLQPVFSTRKLNTSVTLTSGQSVLIGGLKQEQHADGKEPVARLLYVLLTARSADLPKDHAAPLNVLPVAVINPADAAGYVRSPYAPEAKPIDARDLPSGTELKCPVTRNLFRLP